MITRFRLENFKAHRDTELALGQFTVLVGDNGSGKTSVLEAILWPGELAQHATQGTTPTLDDLLRRGAKHMKLTCEGRTMVPHWMTSIEVSGFEPSHAIQLHISSTPNSVGQTLPLSQLQTYKWVPNASADLIGRAALYRFRADQVAASAYGDKVGVSVAEDGRQTAVVLADLKLADDERFDRIEEALRRLVPSIDRLRIAPAMVKHPSSPSPVRGSKLHFDFQGAKNVPGHHASQGTLVVLALLTVLHAPDRPSVILLDDFDHSLHPRAQMELIRMIKELLALDEFRDTQVIATTHSPFMLDEVAPSDVIAFALRDDGTVAAKPLSEHPDAPPRQRLAEGRRAVDPRRRARLGPVKLITFCEAPDDFRLVSGLVDRVLAATDVPWVVDNLVAASGFAPNPSEIGL